MISFTTLWANHPYPDFPCDRKEFENQCAIRMGEAFRSSGIDLRSFRGAKCYSGFQHSPRHILRAQELANWMLDKPNIFGHRTVYRGVAHEDFGNKKGIVFLLDAWGGTDHIDIWDGTHMKGGDPEWFALGKQVWFWELV